MGFLTLNDLTECIKDMEVHYTKLLLLLILKNIRSQVLLYFYSSRRLKGILLLELYLTLGISAFTQVCGLSTSSTTDDEGYFCITTTSHLQAVL